MNTTARAWFITGTDTEIGKTHVACALLHAARRDGLTAVAMKPVAAGADEIDGRRVNEDTARLIAAGSEPLEPAEVTPYCLRSAIAPHIAARDEGVTFDFAHIAHGLDALRARADVVLVEGAGGLLVPLDETRDFGDLARYLDLPVILVVGMRLGCLNHALLTCEAVAARGLHLAGWVANRVEPYMARFDENLATLEARIRAPLLGVVPHGDPADAASLRLPD
ncbi:MAG: dethiobiotin synthase [Azoarcus sp.]|nr:dethiobiotin synthase [Azoarcus sp.]